MPLRLYRSRPAWNSTLAQ